MEYTHDHREDRPRWAGFEGVSAIGLDDLDGALGAGGSGEAPIPGEQGHVERFGEGDIGGVVDGEVVPQLPTATQ